MATLETFLQNHNQLVNLFKVIFKRFSKDSYMIIIKADKLPYGEHAGAIKYNVPNDNKVVVVVAGYPFKHLNTQIQCNSRI